MWIRVVHRYDRGMFRVPIDPHRPTMTQTFKVTFADWMTSSTKQREDWFRRRGAGKYNDVHGLLNPDPRTWSVPPPAPTVQLRPRDQRLVRSVNRWGRVEQAALGIQLVLLLIPVAICVVGGVVALILFA